MMDEVASADDQQSMVALFMEIAAGQNDETARRFLQVTLRFSRLVSETHCIDLFVCLCFVMEEKSEFFFWFRATRFGFRLIARCLLGITSVY